ncbi:ethyl tert-butyl ether degradation [Colletotrichum sojae]|uniref:Ethyl tert-butyl ether degradation n=1 Tax=Colletotrichum sojae TaxID=2175907 RepID=A0A8H6IWN2_9PEZI|nr:ethyl tert-butyl ether degradation [Colletotrichum sojae]
MVRFYIPFVATATLIMSTTAACSHTGLLQMLTYVKRHPDFTREEFWTYWFDEHAPKVAPLATHFNITRYQQVRAGGQILPTEMGADAPASTTPVEFDGVAMFMYRAPEVLAAFVAHPYYTEVVLPDEHVFIDKAAFGGGQVATFVGPHFEVVNDKQDVWIGNSTMREKYQKIFDSYQV